MNPSKLKVVELRAELAARGLDTKGIKSVLVERLQEALDKETGGGGRSAEDTQDHQKSDGSNESELNTTKSSDVPSSDCNNQDEEIPTDGQNNKENDIDKIEEETSADQDQTNCEEASNDGEDPVEESNQDNSSTEKLDQKQHPDKEMQDNNDEQHDTENSEEDHLQDQEMNDPDEEENATEDMDQPEDGFEKSKLKIKLEPSDSGYHEDNAMDVDMHKEDKEKEKEGYEAQVKNEPHEGNDSKHIKTENDIKTERESHREDRKRKRSRSPSLSPYKSRQQSPPRQIKEEEPDFSDTDVILSWYDSDLNLTIDKETFCTATPLTQGGFGFIWAGARGTFGYTSGKLCYQVKLVEYINVSHLENEPNPNVLRVGWSTFDTSMQLGEEPLSFGYGGTGKISVDCQFTNYGKEFAEGDVVTAYLEFEDSDFVISYSVNDEFLGEAWRLPIEELEGKALAPHILTKNVKFAVNFGQSEPWVKIEEGFTVLKDFPIEYAVAGPKRPEKMNDCEIIMMCGLPACGKTTWAKKYAKEHPDMHYNIIGTNSLIEKMKVMGLPRKANYRGRWDLLIDKCTKCLNKLIDIGAYRRRHYILDQTNVYPAAQRRKMRKFEGFTRKAVVIVPTDEEFKARTQKQAQQEKKDVPENAVMEMKANFVLPDKSLFTEIIYPELDENESRSLVHKYNKEAAAAGFLERKGPISGSGGGRGGGGPNVKRFRGDFGHGGQHGHQQHHGGGGGGGGGQRHDGFRRGPPPSAPFRRGPPGGGHGGGGGGGGGGRGGWQPPRGTPDRWRDNRNHGSGGGGGYRQGGGGNERGGGGWRGGNQGGNRGGNRDYDDRNSRGGNFGGDRNRGGRGGGGSGGGGGRDGGRQGGGGGGYSNRDGGRGDNWSKRGQGGSGSGGGGGGGMGGNLNSGSSGGSISASNPQSNNPWGQYQSGGGQNQGQMAPATGGQTWGTQQSWGNPQQQQQQQQWGNYQQGWKGYNQTYSQGYSQQGYSQPTGYGNWQYGYPGYQGWGQNWQNWYQQQNAAAAGQTNTSQPPPAK